MENTREWFTQNREYYLKRLRNKCINCDSKQELQLHHIVPLTTTSSHSSFIYWWNKQVK